MKFSPAGDVKKLKVASRNFCESVQKFKKIKGAIFFHQFLQHFIPHNMDVVERVTTRQCY